MSIYLDLTEEFNAGRLRAIICSGQAVVLHRLAIMSKDGDWIVREDDSDLRFVLGVLARHGARYRFGAPLDVRWMKGGWSSHLEFRHDEVRVRTDFFSRPPRIEAEDLAALWREQEGRHPPFVDARRLAAMKMTNRERDYAFIGELARLLRDPRDQMRYSRSARDLMELAAAHPQVVDELIDVRPALRAVASGRDALERALDEERRALIHANERRLEAYLKAGAAWAAAWPEVLRRIEGLPLPEANERVVEAALPLLPQEVEVPS